MVLKSAESRKSPKVRSSPHGALNMRATFFMLPSLCLISADWVAAQLSRLCDILSVDGTRNITCRVERYDSMILCDSMSVSVPYAITRT